MTIPTSHGVGIIIKINIGIISVLNNAFALFLKTNIHFLLNAVLQNIMFSLKQEVHYNFPWTDWMQGNVLFCTLF